MYGEIAKMTLASFDACKSIEEYVLKRLEKKNAHVKRKTLLLIKHVARSGRPEFRRDLCRNLGPIKECLSFSGPPDPLRGDEMYVKVREAAKEALEAVTASDVAPPNSAAYGGRIEGYGSDVARQPPVGPPEVYAPVSANRYDNYGSAPVARQPESYMEKAAALASGLKDRALDAAATLASSREGGYVGGNERNVGPQMPGAGSRMAGFGNPNFTDARLGKSSSWSEKASSMSRRAGNAVRNLGFKSDMKQDLSAVYASNRGMNAWGSSYEGSYRMPNDVAPQAYASPNMDNQEQQLQQHQQQQQVSAREEPTPQQLQPPPAATSAAGPPRQPGAVGGVWGSMAPSMPQQSRYGGGSETMQHRTQTTGAAPPPPRSVGVGAANRDGEYERQLVNDLCAAGGTRAAPPPEKLADFVKAAEFLDSEVVGPSLLDLLDDDRPAQVKAKALAVIEALALAEGCEHHKEYFIEVAGDLANLATKPPITIQKNARKMLAALGYEMDEPDDAVDTRRAARRAPTQQDVSFEQEYPTEQETIAKTEEQAQVDLLGDYDDNSDQAPPAEPEKEPQPTGGLFEDLALKTPPPKEPPSATPDIALLSVTDEAQEPSPPPQLDPFAATATAEEPTPLPTPAQSAATVQDHNPVDPFSTLGELGKKPPAPPPATGPAFLASAYATPGYAKQQMLQQQQIQMNAQMVALMQQQQALAAQQRQLQQQAQAASFANGAGYSPMAYVQPNAQQHYSVQSVPDLHAAQATGSAFSFMTNDKVKQADSFAFVSDMMK